MLLFDLQFFEGLLTPPVFSATALSESFSELCLFSVSIVSYRSDPQRLHETLTSLALAVNKLRCATHASHTHEVELFLIDNASDNQIQQLRLEAGMISAFEAFQRIRILSGHGNIGYGRGHNLAVNACHSRFHLILNPDVLLKPDALVKAISFLDKHPEASLLAPRILGEQGETQYLCRRYPSVMDLFIRGFVPPAWRSWFDQRLARYEMRDVIDAANRSGLVVWDPDIVSGCFMLFRTGILKKLGGFDPAYFLYFEDYDLSLRTAKLTRIAYVPDLCIIHYGGGAARKGWLHIRLFLRSAWTFFTRHGWRIF